MSREQELAENQAANFAAAVTTCLTTIDVLPGEWQQRIVAIINAAYPRPPAKFDPYSALGQMTTKQQSALDGITSIGGGGITYKGL